MWGGVDGWDCSGGVVFRKFVIVSFDVISFDYKYNFVIVIGIF